MSGVTGRTGPVWERIVADWFMDNGLPWDRAPLRGARDLLDLQGTIPAGFLVGCKGIKRFKSYSEWRDQERERGRLGEDLTLEDAYRAGQQATFGKKISEAMAQCDRALLNLGHDSARNGHGHVVVESNGIIPVQIMQRSGYPVAKSYTVLQTGHFLDLAVRRQKWRDDE